MTILAPSPIDDLKVYGIIAKRNLNSIRSLQENPLKRISRAFWDMRTRNIDLRVLKWDDKLQDIAQKYSKRINLHPQSSARELGTAVLNSEPYTRVTDKGFKII